MTNNNDNDVEYDSEDYDREFIPEWSAAEAEQQLNELNALVISHWLISGEGRVPDGTSCIYDTYAESVTRETRAHVTEQERQARERIPQHLEQNFANAGFAGLFLVRNVYTIEEIVWLLASITHVSFLNLSCTATLPVFPPASTDLLLHPYIHNSAFTQTFHLIIYFLHESVLIFSS